MQDPHREGQLAPYGVISSELSFAGDLSGESGRYLEMLIDGISGKAITLRYKQLAKKVSEDKKLEKILRKIRK